MQFIVYRSLSGDIFLSFSPFTKHSNKSKIEFRFQTLEELFAVIQYGIQNRLKRGEGFEQASRRQPEKTYQ